MAEKNYEKSYLLAKEINDLNLEAQALANIAIVQKKKGNYEKALKTYFKTLKIFEKLGNYSKIAISYINIANIFSEQGDLSKAEKYYNSAIELLKTKVKNKFLHSITLTNLGVVYTKKGEYLKALSKYLKSLEISKEIKDSLGIGDNLSNIGQTYFNLNYLDKALDYNTQALDLFRKLGNKERISLQKINIAKIYLKKNDLKKAEKYAKEAFESSKNYGFVTETRDAAALLKEIYLQKKDTGRAFIYQQEEIAINDSIKNEKIKKEAQYARLKYEMEKKAALDSLRYAKEKKIQELKLKKLQEAKDAGKQKLILVVIILVLISFSAIFWYVEYKKKTRLTQELENQNNNTNKILEEYNQNIEYARQLQSTIINKREPLINFFGEALILHKTSKKISNNFYWWNHDENNTLIAVASTSGKGLTSAFTTIIGVTLLHEIIEHQKNYIPGQIIETFRKEINKIKNENENNQEEIKIGVLSINHLTDLVTYNSFGTHSLLISKGIKPELISNKNIRLLKNTESNDAYVYYKLNPENTGNDISFYITKNDTLFIYTDGLDEAAKQKGLKNIEEFFISNHKNSLNIIKKNLIDLLQNTIIKKDITIIGIRP